MDETKYYLKMILIVLTTPLWILPVVFIIAWICYAIAKWEKATGQDYPWDMEY
jgi:hypothetical protein